MNSDLPVTAILIGAGERGHEAYGRYALDHPGEYTFLAVAEPLSERREAFARAHHIPPERCYESWEPLLAQSRLAEAAFVCTQDQHHVEPALAALAQGYQVMLEKPMATTAEGCRSLVEAAEAHDCLLQIGHVLRYAPFYQAVYQAVKSGPLGEIITLSWRENVSYWHMAHSYVRGNWRSQAESSPMILAKCCHDLDLITWLVGARPRRVSSFGSLRHFRPESAPEGAPQRCAEGCPIESQCIYSALDIYVRLTPLIRTAQMAGNRPLKTLARLYERYPALLEGPARLFPPLRSFTDYGGWPIRVITDDTSRTGRLRAVQDPANPYGRCVYHCDNDVVDHQHVAIDFENGVTATLIMHGHSYVEGRSLRIDGTAATLIGDAYLHRQRLELFDKRSGRRQMLLDEKPSLLGEGHGGGDDGLMRAFAGLIGGRPEIVSSSARQALESHLMAFAAERSRLEGRIVDMAEMRG